ncbi:MAG TPA: hypothetical protein VEB66_09520 [Opitutaceae bacterium]|nr:hypothetical protein [Opitutaceae bacterium]
MRVSFLLLLGALLAGCAGPRAAPPEVATGLAALEKGLTFEQLRARWGEPTAARPLRHGAEDAVVWIYRRPVKTSDAPVATTVEEVPYFDPLTGVYTPILDPHHTLATTQVTQVIELVFIDGQLAAWKRSLTEEKNFN